MTSIAKIDPIDILTMAEKSMAAFAAVERPIAEISGALEKLTTQLTAKEAEIYAQRKITLERSMQKCMSTAEHYLNNFCGLRSEWNALISRIGKSDSSANLLPRINQFLGSLKIARREYRKFRDQLQTLLIQSQNTVKDCKESLSMCEQRPSRISVTPLIAGKIVKLITGSWPKLLNWLESPADVAIEVIDYFVAYNRQDWLDQQAEKFQKHLDRLDESFGLLMTMEKEAVHLNADIELLREVMENGKARIEKKLARHESLADGAQKVKCRN